MEANCIECLQKHLAAALSYLKEILSGKDYVIDALGELCNAEHHAAGTASLVDIRGIRRSLQGRGMVATEQDFEELRRIYNSLGREDSRPAPQTPSTRRRDKERYSVELGSDDALLAEMVQKNILNEHETVEAGGDVRISAIPINPVDLNLLPSVRGVCEFQGEEAVSDSGRRYAISWKGRLCCLNRQLAARMPFALPLDDEARASLKDWLAKR